jgi:hypothetical protein
VNRHHVEADSDPSYTEFYTCWKIRKNTYGTDFYAYTAMPVYIVVSFSTSSLVTYFSNYAQYIEISRKSTVYHLVEMNSDRQALDADPDPPGSGSTTLTKITATLPCII